MKPFTHFVSANALGLLLAGLLLEAATLSSSAQITLVDNNSIARVDPTSPAGMYYWAVQSSPNTFQNQLNQQWFWYRLGTAGPEAPINSISSPLVQQPTPNSATTTYFDSAGRFNVKVGYTLTGGSPTSGTADIGESITINNTSGNPLDYHFFQYSDFNLAGDGTHDSVFLSKNSFTMRFNQADQVNGADIVEVVTSPNANHAEANLVPITLSKLNDAGPTTLDDTKLSATGDVAWALQWDVTIAAGSSFIISKDKTLSIQFIPEPSLAAMLPLGLAAFAWFKRRR